MIRFTDLFSFKGRMGRWQLLQADICLILSFFFYFFLATMLMSFAAREAHSGGDAFFMTFLAIALLVLIVLILWSLCAVYTRRMHDLNVSGYWVIAVISWFCIFLSMSDVYTSERYAILPRLFSLLAWAPILFLLLIPGNREDNFYGPSV